jgi:hypothetical protein
LVNVKGKKICQLQKYMPILTYEAETREWTEADISRITTAEVIEADLQAVLNTLTEHDCQDALKK